MSKIEDSNILLPADDNKMEDRQKQELNEKEEEMAWKLELWKRSQQTQFKAYLKQLEFEYLSKLQMEPTKRQSIINLMI